MWRPALGHNDRMEAELISTRAIAAGGFLLGLVFGFVGNRTNFCTLGAFSDVVNMGDWTRMRMWVMAVGVAVLGVAAMQAAGLVDVGKSLYAGNSVPWLSHVVGGLMFGVGMALASGCSSKALIRIGGGNLKSLVVFLVLGISAYATLKGLFGVWRVNTVDLATVKLSTSQTLPALVSASLGLDRAHTAIWLPALIGLALIGWALADRDARRPDPLLGGVVVGLVIVGGWYLTGHVGHVAEHPKTLEEAWVGTQGNRPESLSLVAPIAYTLELLMFWSDQSRVVTFGIGSALGIVAGSLAWALISRTYREETFPDAVDFKRHVLGAALMGVGGVTALGCTIGHGLSGLSTLSVGSMITIAAIGVGVIGMMKLDYWRMTQAA